MMWVFFVWIWLLISGYFLKFRIRTTVLFLLLWLQTFFCVGFVAWLSFNRCVPLIRMLLLVVTLFLGMKTVVFARFSKKLSFVQWLTFSCFWIGMNPCFVLKNRNSFFPKKKIFKAAILNLLFGALVLIGTRFCILTNVSFWICALLTLVGISMVFHFGILNLWACVLHFFGYSVKPAFQSPLKSKSLTAFWGKDWNLAFVQMTTRSVYQPVQKYLGKPSALLFAFLVSGIFHEIAITLPVNSGFGGPLIYFTVQGVFVLLEKKLSYCFPDKMKKISRWILYPVLLLPLPLLFPPAFIKEVLFQIFAAFNYI